MKPDDTPTEKQRDDAALWLARTSSGPLVPETAEAFDIWLNADRRHRRAYDELRILYARLEAPAHRADAIAPLRRRLATRLRPRGSWLFAPLVSALALLAIWLFDPAVIQNWQADVVTSQQFMSVVILPDGSIARLGADTALSLDFQNGHRHVKLLRGEAYFEVKHGASGAFTVQANGDEIRDIGTKFDVNLVRDQTEVFVAEGSVEVSGNVDDADPTILNRDEEIIITRGRSGKVRSVDPSVALSWMAGRLVVQGATVEDVVAILQRHKRGWIAVRGDAATREISGTFPLTDVDASLATIASAVQGTLVHASPLLTVLY